MTYYYTLLEKLYYNKLARNKSICYDYCKTNSNPIHYNTQSESGGEKKKGKSYYP